MPPIGPQHRTFPISPPGEITLSKHGRGSDMTVKIERRIYGMRGTTILRIPADELRALLLTGSDFMFDGRTLSELREIIDYAELHGYNRFQAAKPAEPARPLPGGTPEGRRRNRDYGVPFRPCSWRLKAGTSVVSCAGRAGHGGRHHGSDEHGMLANWSHLCPDAYRTLDDLQVCGRGESWYLASSAGHVLAHATGTLGWWGDEDRTTGFDPGPAWLELQAQAKRLGVEMPSPYAAVPA